MSLITVLLGSKISAGVLVAGVAVTGGTGVAAYADLLPSPLQQTAHTLIGAPAPEETDATGDLAVDADAAASDETTDETTNETVTDETETVTDETVTDETETADDLADTVTDEATSAPVGPDATGPAASGLCNAYVHGGLSVTSVAYTSLVTAAGSADGITDYCASIPAPGNSAEHKAAAAAKRAAKAVTATTDETADDAEDVADEVEADVTTTTEDSADATVSSETKVAKAAKANVHASVKANRH